MSKSQIKLGEKLNKLRIERKKSKKEIANIMGISVYRYNRIENGEGVFYIEQAKRLVEYYGICLDSLAK